MLKEDHLTIEEAVKIIPSKPSINAVWRWCRRGVRARNGETVLLECRRYGGKLFTSREALDRFAAALAAADAKHFERTVMIPIERVPTRSKKRRLLEIQSAKTRLSKAGI